MVNRSEFISSLTGVNTYQASYEGGDGNDQ
jgi:hypothetical protein